MPTTWQPDDKVEWTFTRNPTGSTTVTFSSEKGRVHSIAADGAVIVRMESTGQKVKVAASRLRAVKAKP